MTKVTTKELWAATARPTDEVHPADDGYLPPVNTVKLPSRGLVYPPESPLYRCETVDIKPVTAKEEDILSSQTLIKKGIVMTALMRACITNRLIDPDKMLVGDRNAVLVSIRVSAYGPSYNCEVICPDCAETCKQHSFDLSRLGLKELGAEPFGGPGSNEFSFVLPISKKEVRFKLLTGETASQLDRDIEELRKKGQERGVTARLMAQLTSVVGVEHKDLHRFVASMPAQDSRALRSYMTKIEPAVDMVQDFECPSCGTTTEVDIPIGTEFFWPSIVE